jgi:hypothetical protein
MSNGARASDVKCRALFVALSAVGIHICLAFRLITADAAMASLRQQITQALSSGS